MVATNILLVIAAAIIAVVAGLAAKQKKSRMTGFWIAAVIGVVGILPILLPAIALQFPILTQDINLGGGGQQPVAIYSVPTSPQAPVSSGICAVEDTTITLSGINKYTSAASSGTHKYRINGAPALTVSDAGTFTASPGDKLEILWMSEGNTYYGEVSNEVVPCLGTKTFSKELVSNGTLTIEVYNEEGNLISTDGVNNETLAAGDVVTLNSKIKGTYQKGMSLGGVLVVEYNKTSIDDVIVEFGGSKVSVPPVYSITFGSDASTKAYSIPSILSNQILEGKITIDADDTNNPAVTANDVKLKLYINDYYVDDLNGGAFSGPAVIDENDAATQTNVATSTIYVL